MRRHQPDLATRPLRVAMVTPRFFPLSGGVETHVWQVARRLIAGGVHVEILTADATGTLPPTERVDGIPVRRLRAFPRGRDYYFAPDLLREIQRGDWDLVHCQSYHTLIPPLAMLAALRARVPYILTFHGGGHSSWLRTQARRPQLAALRPLLARAARLVAVAHFEIEHYGRLLNIAPERFAEIPNGGDLPVAEAIASEPGLIVSVGRLERYKGHQRLIAALPHVLAQRPDARVRIVGGGPYEPALRALAARLGVMDNVTIGAIDPTDRHAMARIVQQAELVTLLSDYETHPVAALEALALQRPLLVTQTSGLAELVQRGQARGVALDASPAQIGAALLAQLGNPLRGGAVVLPTWDDCAEQLHRLYESVLCGHSPVLQERHSCVS